MFICGGIEVRNDESSKAATALATVWDGLVLRAGDSVSSNTCTNVNRWNTPGFLTMAWKELRHRNEAARGHVGVFNSNRSAEALVLLGALTRAAQKAEIKSALDNCVGETLMVRHHHDATPLVLNFGILQSMVESVARYPVQEEDARGMLRWKAVTYEEYKRRFPHASTTKGSLEVFGQMLDISWTSRQSGLLEYEKRSVNIEPMILERGSANCISEASAKASPLLTLEGLAEIALKFRWVFVAEVPDEHKACVRHQGYRQLQLQSLPNVLYTRNNCMIHKLHRIVSAATTEDDIIGHVHAVQTVYSDTSHKKAVMAAGKAEIIENIAIVPGSLDAQCIRMQKALVQHTVLRTQMFVGGQRQQDCESRVSERSQNAIDGLLFWCNSDWRIRGRKRISIVWTAELASMFPGGQITRTRFSGGSSRSSRSLTCNA